jgi:radical SAM family uncharacterized protein/radical SAM-linked protein
MNDDFVTVSKPSRYMGREINSIAKDPNRTRLRFALAFPDVYEIGMSHLGIQILYHILNQAPEIACERVFAPWPDMEKYLRSKNSPLASLESLTPLKDFDVIGFSLQYEMNYTGVLNILDLSGIPLLAKDRGEESPVIIGGGPCAMNPEPLADFLDAFVLGDGEEAILEVSRVIMNSRDRGESKNELLQRLADLEGVYIPSFFRPEYELDGRLKRMVPLKETSARIRRRVLADLNQGDFPHHPLVPYMQVIHDRLNIEIARGCTRGCRFCQAGMIYRPLRERSPKNIFRMIKEGLKNTGYDEVSLLSLSTGDYSCIEPLIARIMDHYREERVAISLPSLRVETLKPEIIRHILEVRKTGFTLAPEAGTERLRKVINKGNTEIDLLATLRTVFSLHWRLVKLYFMIGLPTETEEDLSGIVSLCQKALKEARRARAEINISISNFIPKAHTPFQWEAQCSREELHRKQLFLRKNAEKNGLNIKWADARLSLLEGVFARGDRRLGKALQSAYQLGCRLDGWSDHFRYDLWENAFSQVGLDPSFYTTRRRDFEECLPWDHLDSRVSKEFLKEEWQKANAGEETIDCRNNGCTGCGVCNGPILRNQLANPSEFLDKQSWPMPKIKTASGPIRRFRLHYKKMGAAKFLGHLELSQAMARTFRRAEFPLVFSQGFHPLPKISFGPPIPVGYESWAEFLDIQIQNHFPLQESIPKLNLLLPPGIKILKAQEIPLKSPSIFAIVNKILYSIHFSKKGEFSQEKIKQFNAVKSFPIFWERKNSSIDLKDFVDFFNSYDEYRLKISLRSGKDGFMRPEEALGFIFGWPEEEKPFLTIKKLKVQFSEPDLCPMKS